MSTHNIGFYENLTKIIFELSSNIIKYAPYFFCWSTLFAIPAASFGGIATVYPHDLHLIVITTTLWVTEILRILQYI